MKSHSKLFRLLGVFIISLGLLPLLAQRVNNPPTTTTTPGPCPGCDDSATGQHTGSLSFWVKIGTAHLPRPATFRELSHTGITEGSTYGSIRNFDQIFQEFYGQNDLNRPAAYLEFEVPELTADVFHPAILDLRDTADIELIKQNFQGKPYIRQALAEDTFTHINPLNPNADPADTNYGTGFRVRIWHLQSIVPFKANGQTLPAPIRSA